MPVLVKASNVVKDFPAGDEMVRVLYDIDLNIYFGQLTMLVGPSGCGKTTLISLLTGILSVSEGEIEIL
ncbi:MAG: ATP-binding cassette domain-containing protein, partial [Parachlamydiaceae bacterium]